MFQARYLNVISLLYATLSQGFGREPVCSKFHYEEQLLEKMIRQEIKGQEMETEIKKTLESISTLIDNMEEKINKKADDLNSEIKQNLEEVSTLMDNMEQKMNKKTDDMNSEIKQKLDKVSIFMDDIKPKMDDMTDRIDELQHIADKVDFPRVGFHVYNVNDVEVQTKGQIFIFTTILLNEGNGYNSNTGKFTAPVAGLYYFTAHVCNFTNRYIHYGITVDQKTVAASVQRAKHTSSCSSVSTITVLKKGSSVSVESRYTHHENVLYQDNNRQVSFSGALLHK